MRHEGSTVIRALPLHSRPKINRRFFHTIAIIVVFLGRRLFMNGVSKKKMALVPPIAYYFLLVWWYSSVSG